MDTWITFVGVVVVTAVGLGGLSIILMGLAQAVLADWRGNPFHPKLGLSRAMLRNIAALVELTGAMGLAVWLGWLQEGYDSTGRYGVWLVLLSLAVVSIALAAFWLQVRYVYRTVRKPGWIPARGTRSS